MCSKPKPKAQAKEAAKGSAAKKEDTSTKGHAGRMQGGALKRKQPEDEKEDEEFEVVPQKGGSSSDGSGSDDDDDELDYLSDDSKAEILAIAKKMLKRKVTALHAPLVTAGLVRRCFPSCPFPFHHHLPSRYRVSVCQAR